MTKELSLKWGLVATSTLLLSGYALYVRLRKPAKLTSADIVERPTQLRNTYVLVRHAQSHANVDKRIASDLETSLSGSLASGLTDKGREQAMQAAVQVGELMWVGRTEALFY